MSKESLELEKETRIESIKADYVKFFGANNLVKNSQDKYSKTYAISDLCVDDTVIIKRSNRYHKYYIVPVIELTKQRIKVDSGYRQSKLFDIKTLELTRDTDRNNGWDRGILILPSFANYLETRNTEYFQEIKEEIKRKHILLSNNFTYALDFNTLEDAIKANEALNSYVQLLKQLKEGTLNGRF